MKKAEMAMILTEIYSLFPQYAFNRANLAGWMNLFGDVDANEFRTAIHASLKTSERFPTPGVVQSYLSAASVARGDGTMHPSEAWDKVLCAAHNINEIKNKLAEYPIILEAARLTGLSRIALTDFERLDFVRRDFEQIYRDLCKRSERKELMQIPNRAEAKLMLSKIVKELPEVSGSHG